VIFRRTVEGDVNVVLYVKPIFVVLLVAGLIGLVLGIVLPIVLVKRHKREKGEAEIIQVQEVIKPKSFYCSNCGAENIDITSDYCSKCGSKIKR